MVRLKNKRRAGGEWSACSGILRHRHRANTAYSILDHACFVLIIEPTEAFNFFKPHLHVINAIAFEHRRFDSRPLFRPMALVDPAIKCWVSDIHNGCLNIEKSKVVAITGGTLLVYRGCATASNEDHECVTFAMPGNCDWVTADSTTGYETADTGSDSWTGPTVGVGIWFAILYKAALATGTIDCMGLLVPFPPVWMKRCKHLLLGSQQMKLEFDDFLSVLIGL